VKARLVLLAFAIVALAVGAAWVAGRLDGKPDAIRTAIVWALPTALFLAARLTIGRRPMRSGLRSTPALLPWVGAALALDLAPIGAGYALDWITLTYGDQALAASRTTTVLWALPLLVLVSIRFREATLRGALFDGFSAERATGAAWIVAAACGALLALPLVAPGGRPLETPYVAAVVVAALARELVAIALYRAAGLLAAGLYIGVHAYVEGYAIGDWISPLFPSANYVTSTDAFYALRAAGPLAAAALVVFGLRRRDRPGAAA
jgi:hypothetical protein